MYKLSTFTKRILAYVVDLNFITLVEVLLLLIIPKSFASLLLIPTSLYFAICTSSSWQCSFGQRLIGIYVLRLNKKPIDFIFALDRYLAQLFIPVIILMINHLLPLYENLKMELLFFLFVANLAFISWYVSAFFRDNKQTVHDVIFKTIVVEGRLN